MFTRTKMVYFENGVVMEFIIWSKSTMRKNIQIEKEFAKSCGNKIPKVWFKRPNNFTDIYMDYWNENKNPWEALKRR